MKTFKHIAVAGLVLFGSQLIPVTSAMAQSQATCAIAEYRFDNIPTNYRQTVPSVRNQISWLGLAAKKAGCRARITCVQVSESEADKREAARVCRSARTLFLQTWQHVGNDAYNQSLLKDVGLRYRNATQSAGFGTVFIQLVK